MRDSHLRQALLGSAALGLALACWPAGPDGSTPVAAQQPATPVPPQSEDFSPASLPGGAFYGIDSFDLPAGSPLSKDRQQVIAVGGRLMRADRGQGWAELEAPFQLRHLVASSNGVLLVNDAAGKSYRSDNVGRSWTSVNLESGARARFLSVSENYARDGQALAITLPDWLLYRYDRARGRWNQAVLRAGETHQVGAAAFSPNVVIDELVLAGADDGIYRSQDAGQTWQRVAAAADGAPRFGEAGGRPEEQGIVFPREFGDDRQLPYDADDPTVFAYNQDGLYRSDDKGQTWRKLPFAGGKPRDLAVSNAWPYDPVLLLAVDAPGRIGALSQDGGQTWSWVDGAPGIVGTGAALSRDFGVPGNEAPYNWDPRKGPTALSLPALYRAQSMEPVQRFRGSREAFLSTDGDGIWSGRLVEGADGSERAVWDAPGHQASDISLSSGEPTALLHLGGGNVLAGSRAAGLYRSADGGRTWVQATGAGSLPRGGEQAIHQLRQAGEGGALFAGLSDGVWTSQDNGRTWRRLGGPAPARALALSPDFARDRRLYASGQVSTDGGELWTPLAGPVAAYPWSAVAISAAFAQDGLIFAALDIPEEDRSANPWPLWRSSDRGQSWEAVQVPVLRGTPIHGLATVAAGADPLRIVAATARGLVLSSDAGKTWSKPAGLPNQAFHGVAAQALTQPFTTAVIVAAGEAGVYWSINRGTTWISGPKTLKDFLGLSLAPDGRSFLLHRWVGLLHYDKVLAP